VFSIDRGAYHLRYGPRMCPMGPGSPRKRALRRGHTWTCIDPELSMGWVDPWVGLDRVTQNGPMDNSACPRSIDILNFTR